MDNVGSGQAGLLLLAVLAELAWALLRRNGAYDVRDSLSNIFIALVNNAMKPVTLVWK